MDRAGERRGLAWGRRCERCQGGQLCPVDLQSCRSSLRPHRRCPWYVDRRRLAARPARSRV